MSRRTSEPKLNLKPGEFVLVGSYYSKPHEWFHAVVLWSDAKEVLTSHAPPSTPCESYRQILDIEQIRAVGDLSALMDFQNGASAAVKPYTTAVSEAESELGRARDALRRALDEANAAKPVRLGVPQEIENSARCMPERISDGQA